MKTIWRLLEPMDAGEEGDQWSSDWLIWRDVDKNTPLLTIKGRRRLVKLPEPQGWIDVRDRMPTAEDSNNAGAVLWLSSEDHVEYGDWDDAGEDSQFWSAVADLPFQSKDSDEQAWDEWSSKNLMRNYSLGNEEASKALKEGFLAGRNSLKF
jgi:hypothetical protein